MTRFKSAAHLASWAGMAPGQHESAGKKKRHVQGMEINILEVH
jgi:transposase